MSLVFREIGRTTRVICHPFNVMHQLYACKRVMQEFPASVIDPGHPVLNYFSKQHVMTVAVLTHTHSTNVKQ